MIQIPLTENLKKSIEETLEIPTKSPIVISESSEERLKNRQEALARVELILSKYPPAPEGFVVKSIREDRKSG